MAVTRTSVSSAMASGAAGITVAFGTGAAPGNLGILIVENANQQVPTPSGWSVVDNPGLGTAGAAGAVGLQVFRKNSITSGDISSGISVADGGDHQSAILLTYSGFDTTTPTVRTMVGNSASSTASVSLGTAFGTTTIGPNDIALAIIATDRDSATASTNGSPAWNNISGSNNFIANFSSATNTGGGIIVNEMVPSGTQTAAVTFGCTITSSIYIGIICVIKAPASGTAYNDTLTETVAASASLANAAGLAAGLNEASAAAASPDPAGSTFAASLSENASAGAAVSSSAAFVNALAESGSAADIVSGGLLQGASLNEAASPADNAATTMALGSSLSETAAASDSLAALANFAAPLTATTAASDAFSGAVVASAALTEAQAAADSFSSSAVMPGAIAEAANAASGLTLGAQRFDETIGEMLAANDNLGTIAGLNVALGETSSALAGVEAAATSAAALSEEASTRDNAAARADLGAAVDEAAAANDDYGSARVAAYPPGGASAERVRTPSSGQRAALVRAMPLGGAMSCEGRKRAVSAGSRVGKVARAGR